jgi:SAM-dependent methyltransferase
MSTEVIYQAVLKVVRRRLKDAERSPETTILDIGAGRGRLLSLLLDNMPATAYACDYHPERFEVGCVPIERVNLDSGVLPYQEECFDLVTCSEVIEHVENYHALLREAYRVMKRGGLLILTTPNVLNMKSRVRYFASGFANLFGPLPVKNDRRYSTAGHITPVPFFYLSRALLHTGFTDIQVDIDKVQKTSLVCLILVYPLWVIAWRRFLALERKRYRTMTEENAPHVLRHGTTELMVGRTLLVSAFK